MAYLNEFTVLGQVNHQPTARYTQLHGTCEVWLSVIVLHKVFKQGAKADHRPMLLPVRLRGTAAEYMIEHFNVTQGVVIKGQLLVEKRHFRDSPFRKYTRIILDGYWVQLLGEIPLLKDYPSPGYILRITGEQAIKEIQLLEDGSDTEEDPVGMNG